MKIISQLDTLLFTLYLLESIYSIYSVFYISMLELVTSNTFSKRTQPIPVLVIINKESKYEIL